VLAADALYLYDITSSQLIRRVAIDALAQHSSEHCLPDMVLDGGGTVFMSSAIEPKLWRVDASSYALTEHRINVDSDVQKDFGFSAITFAGKDSALYAASASTGALWKIDPLQ
jgi:hypothetical protein